MKMARQRKVSITLSLRRDLVHRAEALGLDISEAVDVALDALVSLAERDAWLRENTEAIDVYNAGVDQRGLFGDDWRSF